MKKLSIVLLGLGAFLLTGALLARFYAYERLAVMPADAEINAVAASIAAAVEEQSAATQEIVRNVAQASHGTSEVTGNITNVARASEATGAAAAHVLTSASGLSRQSEHLSAEVRRFLASVRAA